MDDVEHQEWHEELKAEIEVELTTLKQRLVDATDKKAKAALDEWMSKVEWGSEFEAERLIVFIKTYRPTKENARTSREDAIKSGITQRIEAHFAGLLKARKAPSAKSIELLSWGLYGSETESPKKSRIDRINEQVVNDALSISKTGESPTISESARKAGVDRSTVRSDRKSKGYKDSLGTTVEYLGHLKKKHSDS